MFIPTHRIIAHHVYRQIRQNLNISLNPHMFAYGNMKPDVAPKLKAKKHYMEPTFDFVLDEIMRLIEDGVSENALSIGKFSVRLGVICHFLCDFFCLPHHDREYFSDKLMEHMLYERDLHGKFTHFSGIDRIRLPYVGGVTKEDIKKAILELHADYTASPRGHETDMRCSVNVASAVGIWVIENSILCEPVLEPAHS